ncbi:unnamed protein product [Rotaria sp. Silwood2]|nr:unnamed protein product [Rotaria sp. Silwood2]
MNFSFPKVRCAANDRRFISPAVESLIKEIKKHIRNKELAWLFENCFPNTLDTTVEFHINTTVRHQPDTYVITGDIDAMWLRDSSAQVHPYLPLMRQDAQLRLLIEGVLLRQCLCIQRDPYANAHYKYTNRTSEWQRMDQTDMRPGVHERKWELDSLCYRQNDHIVHEIHKASPNACNGLYIKDYQEKKEKQMNKLASHNVTSSKVKHKIIQEFHSEADLIVNENTMNLNKIVQATIDTVQAQLEQQFGVDSSKDKKTSGKLSIIYS